MKKRFDETMEHFTQMRKRRRLLRRSVALLCAITVLFTLNWLKLDADTLERIPTCGYPGHEHTAECYDDQGGLVCGLHVHTDACYQERPTVDDVVNELPEFQLGGPEAEMNLVTEDMEEPAGEELFEQTAIKDYSYTVGGQNCLSLSDVLARSGMPVDMRDIEMVGMTDSSYADLVFIDEVCKDNAVVDYRITPTMSFDRVELAIVTANDILTVMLRDAVVEKREQPAEEAVAEEPVEEEPTEVEEERPAVEEVAQPVEEEEEPVNEEDQSVVEDEGEQPVVEEEEQPAVEEEQPVDEAAEQSDIEEEQSVIGEDEQQPIEEEDQTSEEEVIEEEAKEEQIAEEEVIEEEVVEEEVVEESVGEKPVEEEAVEEEPVEEEVVEEEVQEEEVVEEAPVEEEVVEEEVEEEPVEEEHVEEEHVVEEPVEEESVEEEVVEEEVEEEPVEEEPVEEEPVEEEAVEEEVVEEVEEEEVAEEEEVVEEEVVEEEPAIEEAPALAYPAQRFEESTAEMRVTVDAPEGAFPEGTSMVVRDVVDEQTLADIEDTVSEDFVEVKRVNAVDISFWYDGVEIEPLMPIGVVMTVLELEDSQEAVVVHVDDDGATEVVESQADQGAGEAELSVEMPAGENAPEPVVEGGAEAESVPEDAAPEADAAEGIAFEASAFSVYAVVVTETIETRYIDDRGETWSISVGYGQDAGIPGGAELKVEEILNAEKPGLYAWYSMKSAEAVNAGEDGIAFSRFFDIEIQKDGVKVEPLARVKVEITLADASLTPDAMKVVHFAEDGAQVLVPEITDTADIQFETDSFSVYAVINYSEPGVDGLAGSSVTFNREGRFITSDLEYNGFPRLRKTGNWWEAATWTFESSGTDGQYYISTTVNNQKKYIRMDNNTGDWQSRSIALSDAPENAFSVIRNSDGTYTIYKTEYYGNELYYYLNEWEGSGGRGFAGWHYPTNEDDLTFTFDKPIAQPGTSYAVIIRNPADDRYYAVQNEGGLVEVQYNVEDNTAYVTLDYPLAWTYTSTHDGLSDDTMSTTGDLNQKVGPYNLRMVINSREFDDLTKLGRGGYYRYISPVSGNGIDEETESNSSHYSAKQRNSLVYIDNKLCGVDASNNPTAYIGADFTGLHITGNQGVGGAAEVYLAKISRIPGVGSNNETVSHIDIGIVGKGMLDMPLAYGTYYDENKTPILTVSKNANITVHLEKDVDIAKEDIMAADVTAYDKYGNPLNDVFTITGYSANDTTGDSKVQVRMEGSFKVDTLTDEQYSQVANGQWNRNLNETWRNMRRENQVYYKVAALKDVTFDLKYNGQQLYDRKGNKLTITAKVCLSAGFSYWDENNECPPVLSNFETKYGLGDHGEKDHPGHSHWWWERGAIINNDWSATYNTYNDDHYNYGLPGDSGMDFILGNKDESDLKIVAIEIVKVIENENGERIYLKPGDSIENSFTIYYDADGLPSSVRTLGVPDAVSYSELAGSNIYDGYSKLSDAQVVVGSDGIGVTYDYDVEQGMFYVTEDKTALLEGGANHTIIDANDKEWTYKETRIETEYVWRDNQYNGMSHVSQGTQEDRYAAVPEVLGDYLDDRSNEQYNRFLEFYIYNVYTTTPTELEVEKEWEGGVQDGAEVEVTLKRYKLSDYVVPSPNGSIAIRQTLTGQTNGSGFTATYDLKQDDTIIATATINAQMSGASFLNVVPGDYTVVINSSVGEQYEVTNAPESYPVTVTAGGLETVSFTSMIDGRSSGGDKRIVYLHSSDEDVNSSDPYNTGKYIYKRFYEYAKGTSVTITFDNGIPEYNPYNGHDVYVGGNYLGTIDSTQNHISFTFNVGYDDEPLHLYVSNTGYGNWENILKNTVLHFDPEGTIRNGIPASNGGRGVSANARAMRLVSASEPIGAINNGTAPSADNPDYQYAIDEDWEHTVTLNKDNNWKLHVQDVEGLVKHDTNGANYLYFIYAVSESGVPEGTTVRIVNNADGSALTAEDGTLTLKAVNTAPTAARIKGTKAVKNGGGSRAGYEFELTPVDGAPMRWADAAEGATATSAADGRFEFGDLIYTLGDLTNDVNNVGGNLSRQFTYSVTEVVPNLTEEERNQRWAIRNNVKYDLNPVSVTVTVRYDKSSGTMSAEVSPDQAALVIENEQLGSLQVTKTVKLNGSPDTVHENRTFYVGLFSDASTPTATGTVKPIEVVNGAATGSVTFDNLTIGSRYYVYETDSAGRKLAVGGKTNGYFVVINGGQSDAIELSPVTVNIENERRTGNLELKKVVTGTSVDEDKEFIFTIHLTAPSGETLAERYSYTQTGVDGEQTLTLDRTDDDTKATVTGIKLKHNEVYAILGLPEGTGYAVSENDYSAEGYAATWSDTHSGSVPGGATAKASVVCTNTLSAGGLTVQKTLSGNAADQDKAFAFTVTFEKDELTGAHGSYKQGTDATIGQATATDITFGDDNKATVEITLKGGEKVEFSNVPEGTSYTVQETSADQDGYETTVKLNGTTQSSKTVAGTIAESAAVTVDCVNAKDNTFAEATKKWTSGTQTITWPEDVESVTFKLFKTVNGVETEVLESDLASFWTSEERLSFQNTKTISRETDGHRARWDNLPKKYLQNGVWYEATYTVKETTITYTEASQITPRVKELETPITADGGFITNDIPKISISATKEWQDKNGQTLTAPHIPAGAQVTFTLQADGANTTQRVLLNGVDDTEGGSVTPASHYYEGADWTAWFTQLPKYTDAGKVIRYTVKETGKWSNYAVEGPDTVEDNGTVVNREQTGGIRVTKEIRKAGTVNTAATGTFKVGLFRMTEVEGVWTPAASPEATGNINVTANGTDYIEFDNLSIGDKYAVYELDASNNILAGGAHTGVYTVRYGSDGMLTIALDTTLEVTIVNDEERVDIDVTKTWMNGEVDVTGRLKNASVTFTLEKSVDGGESWTQVDSQTISNGDEAKDAAYWTASWINQSKCADGVAIMYRVVESDARVNGEPAVMQPSAALTTTFDECDFVSKQGHANPTATADYINVLPTTEITVKKTWSHATDWPDGGIQVQMTLYADGSIAGSLPDYTHTEHDDETGDDVEKTTPQYPLVWLGAADAENGYTWHSLPKYRDDGSIIAYTAAETGMQIVTNEGDTINISDWSNAFMTTVGDLTNGVVTIDNTPRTTDIKVTKVWTLNHADKVFGESTSIAYALKKTSGTGALDLSKYTLTADKGDVERNKVEYIPGNGGGWQTVTISGLPMYELADSALGKTYVPVNYYVEEDTGSMGNARITYSVTPEGDGAEAGEEKATASQAATNAGTITIHNRDTDLPLKVLKVDSTDHSKYLDGAEFQLQKKKADGEYAAYTKGFFADSPYENGSEAKLTITDKNEGISFRMLSDGDYMLVETKTPAGYVKLVAVGVEFTVADGVITPAIPTDDQIVVGYSPVTNDNAVDTVTIANTPGARLPATGGSGTTPYYVAGAALVLIALALLLRRRLNAADGE